jgi:nitroimidazol reductase NimA-like FMN-containing flavoprotein (pyridoxamine 5'-phosphate oxidase superfamily)
MQLQRISQRIGNVFIGGILRSPFHAMFSKNTLLLTFTGRVSGKQYSTPVNYAFIGDELYIFSRKDRTWWRNLCGGAPVMFQLRGRTLTGWGEAFEDEAEVERGLMVYIQAVPHFAKYYEVSLDEEGRLKREDVARAAEPRILVKITRDE